MHFSTWEVFEYQTSYFGKIDEVICEIYRLFAGGPVTILDGAGVYTIGGGGGGLQMGLPFDLHSHPDGQM